MKRQTACILSRRVFPWVRVPLLIIENHCNPISLPGGRHDVKSRGSRLRSFHPNEPARTPIAANKAVPRRTCNNRVANVFGTLHPPGQTAPTRRNPHIVSLWETRGMAVHCENASFVVQCRFITTDEDVRRDEVFTA